MQAAENIAGMNDVAPIKLSVIHVKGKKTLRICLLGYRSHPYCGGQGIYIKYLSKALVETGHAVDVISGEPYPELDPRVRLIKMPGLNLFEAPNRFTALRLQDLKSFTNMFEWFSMLTGGFPEPYTFGRRVSKYLGSHLHHYDLIHDNQSLSTGLLSLQKNGVPVVATIHHPITRDMEIALAAAPNLKHRLLIRRWHSFLRMQKKVVQKLNHLVTVSECSRRDIAQAFGVTEQNINLVYNGIDTKEFAPMPEIVRMPYRIMTTASADQPLKGLKYLLKAIAALMPRYPDLNLLVIGKPKSDGYTEKLIKRLKLETTVTFVSGIKTEHIVRYYAEATMAVVPSLYEGFGLPAGEAMACAVPVISTDGGALSEVVGNAGIQVPTGDTKALILAITELLESPTKRRQLGEAGRQRILDKFCWTVAARQMTNYYHRVLNNADH
ncbi:MAG: glycosyltransferase family 4 protein [Geobacteraceae bacterium]